MIDVPPKIAEFIAAGALFAVNDSGGKDSQAMRILLSKLIPAGHLVVVHATLGDVEWPGALEHAKDGAIRSGIPFVVAQARKTFFEMVENRHKARPESPCWPSASYRQCTSDLKRDPIARELRRVVQECGATTLVNCMGIRAQESPKRAKLNRVKKSWRNSIAGREWWDWLPIHTLTKEQVFAVIAEAGEKPHPAYAAGNDRLSCMFCIMGSKNDLRNAARANPALYQKYVEMERRTGYTMHQSRISLPVLTGIDGRAA